MRSGEFIKKTKITRDTLRYYNKLGLLSPVVNENNGYKEYSEQNVKDVMLIKSAQSIGFSLMDIKELLRQMASSECRHRTLLPYLEDKLDETNAKIKDLNRIKKHIQFLIKDFGERNCKEEPTELKL